ncbi:UDP-N-acetylmuramate dehydrogenase [Homoserinibacter sp. YIM 151385]|uniref:UDP-N-acetylmuramate dehydrogenase n=1 Tax=Homoserinibacter sp. YIM 151385 TaxID=2985506 RepID=UPI0022F01571|nr:UDP-N-acetylmuramate dehydrogenase [Homoserinibacter sp. YIM 151385]WBU36954.1 UDP-N-acetylmuramate dehydrogenase [Homoserinibacter sp. YIM 151385]
MTVVLADYTTLRIGGPAARLIEPETERDLVLGALEVWRRGEDWLVLGGGSNLLVGDEGFDGTVIRMAGRGVRRIDGDREDRVRVRVQAGEPWDAFVALAIHNGWAGVEALSGIPGSVGAAPIQNIGAYGQDVAETLVAVDFLDEASGDRLRIPAEELQLGYRTSAIKRGRRGIVIAVEFDLVPTMDRASTGGPVRYGQLAAALGVELGARVPLAETRRAVLELRGSKGMVLDAADPDSVSAGSFFTNPIVPESFARGLPADAPRFAMSAEPAPLVVPLDLGPEAIAAAAAIRAATTDRGPAQVKLSAAWLIERAGIRRGFALPGSRAGISSKHTLAIVNRGGATAAEVVQLADYVQTRVHSEFGVRLHPEPVFVGVET